MHEKKQTQKELERRQCESFRPFSSDPLPSWPPHVAPPLPIVKVIAIFGSHLYQCAAPQRCFILEEGKSEKSPEDSPCSRGEGRGGGGVVGKGSREVGEGLGARL